MSPELTTTSQRRAHSLAHALGATIAAALADSAVMEVMANPDGGLWVDRHGTGRARIGTIDARAAEGVIRILATHMGQEVTYARPTVSGTLPGSGERFQGLIPPLVERPTFVIRKHCPVIYSLDDFVEMEVLTPADAEQIRGAIAARQNILIAGATQSGKTTLANACLAEPCFASERVVIIEDTRELQCVAPDCVQLLTKNMPPEVTLRDLVRVSLRLRPDRIVIGEVRGPECIDMLRAFRTGHSGLSTVHASSAEDVPLRLEDLVAEAGVVAPARAVAGAIDLVVFIEKGCANSSGRAVTQIVRPARH